MPQSRSLFSFLADPAILILLLVFLVPAGAYAQAPVGSNVTFVSFSLTDGSNPVAGLVQAHNGYLYGTTFWGGGANLGAIFKIAPNGALTTLYSFCSQGGCADGENPWAELVQAGSGKLYGTTSSGGVNGQGTIFKITPGGALTTIYSFCSQSSCTDGGDPVAGLVQASNGYLYGTTQFGGANDYGTVFKIAPSGELTTLYSFTGTDGEHPEGTLVQAHGGNLYGTTYWGGANEYYGTVFRITPDGVLTTLYNFCSQGGSACTDGMNPSAGLVQAVNGYLYGTTAWGGVSSEGTIFKITPSGALSTIYSFCSQSGCPDGRNPNARLVQASDGNLYGTTANGGAHDLGTIFKITPNGVLTTLYSFCTQSGCPDGEIPWAGLIQGSDGNLYGTASEGGAAGKGTVFRLSLGLPPPASK